MATFTKTIGRGSKNRFVRTENFGQAGVWVPAGTGTIATNQPDPLGSPGTAALVSDTGAGAIYELVQTVSAANGPLFAASYYTASVFMKPATTAQSAIYLTLDAGLTELLTGTIDWSVSPPTITKTSSGSITGNYSDATITASTNGFYRVSITIQKSGISSGLKFGIQVASASAATTGAAYLWGAQFEAGYWATSYISVTAATDPLATDYKDFVAWQAFIAANPSDIHIGQLRSETFYVNSNALIFSRAGTDGVNSYTRIEPAATGYDPVTNTGPKLVVRWASSGTNAALKITESFFRIRGVGFFGDFQARGVASTAANGSEAQPVGNTLLWLDQADDCVFWDCFFSNERGGGPAAGIAGNVFTAAYIGSSAGSGNKALRNSLYNCIAKGPGLGVPTIDNGFYFGNYADLGGAYNCIAYGLGFGFNVASHSWSVGNINSPEVINCIALACGQPFLGFWRRAQYCFSSVNLYPTQWNQDATSTGTNTDTLTNFINVGQNSIWIAPEQQDFRLRPGSLAHDQGLNLNSIFTNTTNGPGNSNDYDGVSRSASLQNWDIGVYEGVDAVPNSTLTVITKTVGRSALRNYPSIGAAIADLPASLYSAQQKYTITCYDDGVIDTIGDTIEFQYFNCITASAYFVEINANKNVDPRTGRAYTIQVNIENAPVTYHRAVLWITTSYTKISGLYMKQIATSASAVNARVVELWADNCTIDSMFMVFGGTSYNLAIGDIFDIKGTNNLVTNCVFRGSDTTGTGASVGLSIETDSKSNSILHCIAFRIKGGTGTASSSGFFIRTQSTGTLLSGCASLGTATSGSGGALDYRFGASLVAEQIADHCYASDTSPGNGAGNISSTIAAFLWKNAPLNDYRPFQNSLLLQGGANLSAIFSKDIAGNPRYSPFDVGVYEGVSFSPLMVTPAPKDHHRLATLWEITRNDGLVHLFCSANEPIDHAGQSYFPVGQTQDAARRMEGALKEHNTEVIGAIVSSQITAEALAAGLYSNARIVERIVDWKYPWTVPSRIAVYYVANIEFDQDTWRAELVGPTIKLNKSIGETHGVECNNEFGDIYCQFNVKAVTQFNISVSSVSSETRRQFSATSMSGTGVTTDDYFGRGKLTWLTGANAGLVHEVKVYTGSTKTIRLLDKTPFDIATNDKFNLSPGCRLRYLLDCIGKYNNGINFGGDPWLEGPDLLLETPTQ